MSDASDLSSGKGHTDENFPVASHLIAPKHRGPIMAFYRFARAGDDIADHPTAPAEEKLARLERLRATLAGESDAGPEARALRQALAARPQLAVHGLELLEAFRRDCTKRRYADWAELVDYCRYSACPVGRFVMDVHGEGRTAWPANDALCTALQIVNHLQDCGKDYAALDRVYLPADALRATGAEVEDLAAPRASPALRSVIVELTGRVDGLLAAARPFAGEVGDLRLALEVAVIQRLAEDLNGRLKRRDPLSERMHHTKPQAAGLALLAVAGYGLRPRRRTPAATPQAALR